MNRWMFLADNLTWAGVARCKPNLWGNGTAQNLQTIPGMKAKSGWDYLGKNWGRDTLGQTNTS